MSTEAIVSKLMELIQTQIVESSGKSLSDKEERALAIGRYVSELAMSEMIETDPDEVKCIICECGSIALSQEILPRNIVTLAGTHKIRRRKYHCDNCGKWTVPRDIKLGIGSGNYSVGVVALTSEVSACFPFEATADFLTRRFALDICYKQVQSIAKRTGTVIYEQEYELAASVNTIATTSNADTAQVVYASKECPNTLTISADGLLVHSDGSWTEMKCASYISEEYGRSIIGTMERVEKFGELLYLEAVRRGAQRAKRLVFVADGAVWIWNLAAHHFPDAVEIVDWYHVTQHLWEIANTWYGEGTKQAKEWVKRNKSRLMEDKVDRVISSIRQWQPKDEKGRVTKRENLHYFTTNAKRMLYATFVINGFCIGSGSVESACKQYGQGRVKQAGMRWKRAGIEAIAQLRSAVINRRTDYILEAAKIAA